MAANDPLYSRNVGTVLFCKSDIKEAYWTKTQLSLLRARKYFQTVLPPPDFINTFSNDCVNILLEYVRDAYANIKKEAKDLETDSILTTALSDALGGYLKAWILPVAKLNYYAGTISQDNVIKLFQFYGEIKSYLDTDGEGWSSPDNDIINSISINVASRSRVIIERPCEQFAYFEKTENGLGIPLPTVNWNDKSSTLFVPLKNVTLIPMIARDTSNILVNYYDSARNCMAESNPVDVEEFDKKFQSWLLSTILPHLKDQHLYLTLGNVLSLLNMTSKYYNSVTLADRCVEHPLLCDITPPAIEMPSKKVTIILIILFLEIVWCIPAVTYLLCSKKKKDSNSNVYLFIDQNKPDKQHKPGKRTNEHATDTKETSNNTVKTNPANISKDSKNFETQFPSTVICRTSTITSALHLGRKKTYYMEFEGQYPSSHITKTTGTGSRTFYTFKNQSSETIKASPTPHDYKRPTLKKRPDSPLPIEAKHVTSLPRHSKFVQGDMTVHTNLHKKSSHSKSSKNLSRRKTDLKPIPQNKPEKQKYEKTEEASKAKRVKIPHRILKTPERENLKRPERSLLKTTESAAMEKEQSNVLYITDTQKYPFTGSEPIVNDIREEVLENLSVNEQVVTEDAVPTTAPDGTENNIDDKMIEIKSARPVQEFIKPRSKEESLEVSQDASHYLKTSIQMPVTEISFNIGRVHIAKEYKRSKIPKPANTTNSVASRISTRIKDNMSPIPEHKRKSCIPGPMKKTLDDMALTSSSISVACNQLNDTF